MTDKFVKPAEPVMKTASDVPEGASRPLVAAKTHFRVLDEQSSRLYLEGEHVPAEHAELEAVPAALVDGVYVPAAEPTKATKPTS